MIPLWFEVGELCTNRCGSKLFEQLVNLKHNFIRPCGSKGKFQQALWRKLCAPLGVARYQSHEVLRIYRCVLHETYLQLAALAVDLGNAHSLALEAHAR